MTDYNCCDIFAFCNVHQDIAAFADLRNTSGRACNVIRINRLNAVNYNKIRHNFFNLRLDIFHVGLRINIKIVRIYLKPVSAEFKLICAFFGGDI